MTATTSDYRYEVRDAAFRLLADRNYNALSALHSVFLDRASHAFNERDTARSNNDDALAEYWTQVRTIAQDLAAQCDAAAQHIPAPTLSDLQRAVTVAVNERDAATRAALERNRADLAAFDAARGAPATPAAALADLNARKRA